MLSKREILSLGKSTGDVKNPPLYTDLVAANKGDFGLSAEFFYCGFAFGCTAAIGVIFLINQFAGRAGMKKAGAPVLSLVLRKASTEIGGDAGVKLAVVSFYDVDEPAARQGIICHQRGSLSVL